MAHRKHVWTTRDGLSTFCKYCKQSDTAYVREITCTPTTEGLVAQSKVYFLVDDLRLAEHKIDQHLQGQYNWLPYPALGVALAAIRRALLEVERGS